MTSDLAILILAGFLFAIGILLALWSAQRQLGLDGWRRGIEDHLVRSEERIESTVGKWRADRYNRDGTPKEKPEQTAFNLDNVGDRAAAKAAIRKRSRSLQ